MLDQKTIDAMKASDFIKDLPNIVRSLDTARSGSNTKKPVDISLGDFVQEQYGFTKETFLKKIGVSTKVDTMQNIFSMPNQDVRWLIPEIIREAVVLGINDAPFYPTLIAGDQPINGLSAIMPFINPSDAAPAKVNEGETIPLGTVSFGQKNVNLFKVGKGIKLTDEVRNYVSLDVLSLFVKDFGKQMGYALDTLLINTLINGNTTDGSESAPVIGVTTANSIVYRDLLRLWVRGGRMGRNFTTLIGGEEIAIDLLDLPEFKQRYSGTTDATLNIKSPVPKSADFYIHSGVSEDQTLLVDRSAAAIKLTAKNLMLESERIVSNQTEAIYASMTTGFAKMYQDASVIIDRSTAFTAFPDVLDVDQFLEYSIEQ